MNEKTKDMSRGLGSRRAFWAATLAGFAVGLTVACSAHDDASYDDVDAIGGAVQDDTVVDKAVLREAVVVAARVPPCENCAQRTVCQTVLVSCDPPVYVNGREIMCLEDQCRDETVCTPCSGEREFDELDVDVLDRIGGIAPIDPQPFTF